MKNPDFNEENHSLPDLLTRKMGVLSRREVEARILAPDIAALARTQTLMEGGTHCDFRYRFPKS